ncbi:hypothetical protein BH23GEM9_BH23GEM9_17660 [soil metagenome]
MNSKEKAIRASWDDNAAAWTNAVREGKIESRVRSTNAAVVSAVQDMGIAKVLDVGCGEGWLCRAVAELGMAAVGFDGSAALIAEAKRLGGGEYQVLGYDDFAAHPARAGGPFDTVVCNYSLLGEDVLAVLRGTAAVLEPGGSLIVQTLHPFSAVGPEDRYENGWRSEDFSGMGAGFKSPMPWYFRTVGSWLSQIRLSGFELLECRETMTSESTPISLLVIAARQG